MNSTKIWEKYLLKKSNKLERDQTKNENENLRSYQNNPGRLS